MISFGEAGTGTGRKAGAPAGPRRPGRADNPGDPDDRRLRRKKRLRGPAAAQGHGQSSGETAGDRLPGIHRQHPGHQYGATQGPGRGLPGEGLLQRRRPGQKRATAVSDPAQHLRSQTPAGGGGDSLPEGQTLPRPDRICPVHQAGDPEGRGPDGRGQLALPAGCGQGRGHVRGGATGPGPAQPELHQGDGALRRPHRPPAERPRQPRGRRRSHPPGRYRSDRPSLCLLHHE